MSDTATVTPIRRSDATPGMLIEDIQVTGRHRNDLGDIGALADSISNVGLLQPVVVTRDGRLVAGERRLTACKRLGWTAIPVAHAESLTDAASLLKAERDENICRKDMLPSELAALGEALHEVEYPAAKERQQQAGREHGRGQIASDLRVGSYSGRETRQVVGEALGMHGTTYNELRSAWTLAHDESASEEERQLARDALAQMDAGRGIKSAAAEMRRKTGRSKNSRSGHAPVPPVAPPRGRDADSTAQRWEEIADLAAQGYSSRQIAERFGMNDAGLRARARQRGLDIPADKIIGKTHRHDSNRIVEETTHILEGASMGLELVNPGDLDPAQVGDWVASLTDSIRAINRFIKTMKETIQ